MIVRNQVFVNSKRNLLLTRAQEQYRDLGDVVDLVLISANVCVRSFFLFQITTHNRHASKSNAIALVVVLN